MKKYFKILSVSFALTGLFVLEKPESKAQSTIDYGGLCCQEPLFGCHHPNGMYFEDSVWKPAC